MHTYIRTATHAYKHLIIHTNVRNGIRIKHAATPATYGSLNSSLSEQICRVPLLCNPPSACMFVCMCVSVCIYFCMNAGLPVCCCAYDHPPRCMPACCCNMYVCMHARMPFGLLLFWLYVVVGMCVCIDAYVRQHANHYACMYVRFSVCMPLCIYLNMYVCLFCLPGAFI